MSSRLRGTTARAIAGRDLRRYFADPTGYIVITLFILLGAGAAFWRSRFFLNNLANLDQLNDVFPYLLIVFLPALCMGLWSEERKAGTDELLLTLPAADAEVVLGKFGAALGIYSAAVLVSLSHVLVLAWLGEPDLGLMAASYLGYWLTGAALIPAGLLASLLTRNTTVAFVLGAVLCAVPVGLSHAASASSGTLSRVLAAAGILRPFGDFARGIVSLDGVIYALSLAGLFLYAGLVVLSRRHWRRDSGAPSMTMHAAVRVAAVAAGCLALVVLAARPHARLDLTAARLYSLSPETNALVRGLPADRRVALQAFVSASMPGPYVTLREDLLGLLREVEAVGGGRLAVTVHETEPFSEEAQLARERYGIHPRTIVDPDTGEAARDVYLGIAATSGAEEQVVPFLDRGLSAEYEIVRAIRVVSHAQRTRLGIVDTDARILGGVDYRTSRVHPAWAVVEELRKQYDVVEVTPAGAVEAQVDALLVVLPSRMTQTEMDLVAEPIARGTPTLIVVDPLPAFDVRLAPAADLAGEIDPYRRVDRGQTRVVFGNIRQMLTGFGLNWPPARVAWDRYNPHPDMADFPPEMVFVGPGNGNPEAFNREHAASRGLQELLLLFPGYFLPVEADAESPHPAFSFEPLVQTGTLAGSATFFELVRPTPAGMAIGPAPRHEPDGRQYAIAARVRSTDGGTDVIAVGDLDFISDEFFQIRALAPANTRFDNISFFLNAIDSLVGDESFIALRSDRRRHRTLDRVEAQTRSFMERRIQEEQQAEQDARTALDAARARVQTRVAEIDARTDIDAQARQILTRSLEETEGRQFRFLETTIGQTRDRRIQASREVMERAVGAIRTRIRVLAVLLPPLPVFLLGAMLFARRVRRERDSARLMHRLRTK